MIKLNGRLLFYLSIFISGYFLLLLLNEILLKLDYILIGFIVESFSISLLLLQFILLFVSFIYWKKDNFSIKNYSFWAFLILILSNAWTLGGLFIIRP
tara:strand:- start:482 stop:775 length:294 start_codon:yes stop_codon:yes gene_type:complete